MDYFVSIENNNYCYWQIELLIQSFKRLGIQDQLLVAIAAKDEPKYPVFTTNIIEHQRKFQHENVGRKQGYLALNRPYSLVTALSSGFLKQPFALIHMDMVLTYPMQAPPSHSVGFDHEAVESVIREKVQPYVKLLLDAKGLTEEAIQPLPVGSVMTFDNIPTHFFNRVYQRTLQLMKETDTDWDVEKGAWLLSLYEHLGLFNYNTAQYSGSMKRNNLNGSFIHYKHGHLPQFNKIYFKFDPEMPISIYGTDPYQSILNVETPLLATLYLQDMVREHKKTQESTWSKLWEDQLNRNIKAAEAADAKAAAKAAAETETTETTETTEVEEIKEIEEDIKEIEVEDINEPVEEIVIEKSSHKRRR